MSSSTIGMTATIQSIYRYPGEGAFTRKAAACRALCPGSTLRGRPALRDRERPLRLRSGGTRLLPETAFPDADAQRAARGARDALSRRKPHACRSCRTAPKPCAATSRRRRAAPRSSNSSPRYCADELNGAAESAAGRRAQLFGCGRQGRVDHQSRLGGGDRKCGERAGRSVALPRQCLCQRLAGLARIRSGRKDHCRRAGAPENRETHRALRGDQCGARHRHPRSADSKDVDAGLRPYGLRHLCRSRRAAARSRPAMRSPNPNRRCSSFKPRDCGRGVCATAPRAGRSGAAG